MNKKQTKHTLILPFYCITSRKIEIKYCVFLSMKFNILNNALKNQTKN